MQFSDPILFSEAVDKLASRNPIASPLKSSEWADIPVGLRERAFFSAAIEEARFLQGAKDALGDFLTGARQTTASGDSALKIGSRADFVKKMQDWAVAHGMGDLVPPDKRGTIQDITTEGRLGLIFKVQTQAANDYGYWRQGMDRDVLNAYPAQRFIRERDVKEPRAWHRQFEDMVRLKTDTSFWRRVNADFGVPWGPWGWGCGHGVEDVSRDEAEGLGLIDPSADLAPVVESFNKDLQASAQGLDPDLLASIKDRLGDAVTIEGDLIRWSAAAGLRTISSPSGEPAPPPQAAPSTQTNPPAPPTQPASPPKPPSPWVDNSSQRDHITRQFFSEPVPLAVIGHPPSGFDHESVSRLSGAPSGSKATASFFALQTSILVENRQFFLTPSLRIIERGPRGEKILHNEMLDLKRTAPEGLGSRIFAMQVKQAAASGFERIDTFAAGSATDPRWNGYYTWGRLGYDAPLKPGEISSLPANLRGAKTVLDLMQTSAGRDWWRANGTGRAMTFDLSPGSRSLRVLESYLIEKGIRI